VVAERIGELLGALLGRPRVEDDRDRVGVSVHHEELI
jgi:hypothetical protein